MGTLARLRGTLVTGGALRVGRGDNVLDDPKRTVGRSRGSPEVDVPPQGVEDDCSSKLHDRIAFSKDTSLDGWSK